MNPDDHPDHPDTVLVDRITAWLNTEHEPSGADTMAYLCEVIDASERPLLNEKWDVTTDLSYDRHGLPAATISAGPFTIRATRTRRGLTVAITHTDADDDRDDLAVTVDDRLLLDPMPGTWDTSEPPDQQPRKTGPR